MQTHTPHADVVCASVCGRSGVKGSAVMLRVVFASIVWVALTLVAPGLAVAGILIVNGGFEDAASQSNRYVMNVHWREYQVNGVNGWTCHDLNSWFASNASAPSAFSENLRIGLWGPLFGSQDELTDSPQGGAFITIDDASFNNPIHRGVNETVAGDIYMQSLYWPVSQQYVYEDSMLQSLAAPVHDQSVRDIKVQSQ